ncbi:hypothetical protein [Streptomyces sp. NPDC058086]|uniref:hypothetical protein n=1 Tax=Streptomyces sp. NPDC058086 TaxID=3346334 RepID=UPI0036E25F02
MGSGRTPSFSPAWFGAAAGQGFDVLLNEIKVDIGEESGLCMSAVPHLIDGQCPRDALAPNPGFDLTLESPCVAGAIKVPA